MSRSPLRFCLCSFLAAVFAFFSCPQSHAQSLPVSATAGPDFSSTGLVTKNLEITGATASFSRILSFGYPLTPHQAIKLSTEYIKLSSSYIKMPGFELKPDWKFEGVPITLSYEYTPFSTENRIVPVMSIGASLYFAKTQVRLPAGESLLSSNENMHKEMGVGYGLQATFGFRTNLNEHTFLLTQVRARRINGLGLSSKNHQHGEFPLFDFVIGFGVKF